MLTHFSDDGWLSWECLREDAESEDWCGKARACHISDVTYLTPDANARRGAVIALPPCACGAQLFLKADYTLAELRRETASVMHEGQIWAYALPLRYVHNLRVHWMLYQEGRAGERAPVVALLPESLRTRLLPESCGQSQSGGAHAAFVYALWFGHLIAQQHSVPRGIGTAGTKEYAWQKRLTTTASETMRT